MHDLGAIQLFVQIVERGSFSAVARSLGVEPSSVSRQLTALEETLGARLINRTTRRHTLTEAGQLLLDYATRIVDQLDEARLAVSQLKHEPSGTLRATVQTDFALTQIVPLLPAFHERYPKVRVRLSLDPQIVDLVAEGYDLAIRFGDVHTTGLIARRIATSRSAVCASPAYLAAAGEPRHPRELANHRCLSFRVRPGRSVWRFQTPNGVEEVHVDGPFSADSGRALVQMALAGLGIILMPLWLVGDALQSGELLPILSEYGQLPESSPISAVFPHRTLVAPKVRAFVDFLAENLVDEWPIPTSR